MLSFVKWKSNRIYRTNLYFVVVVIVVGNVVGFPLAFFSNFLYENVNIFQIHISLYSLNTVYL